MNVGIILAAGSSSRFDKEKQKQFEVFQNKMLLEYSLETFLDHPNIDLSLIHI